MHRSKLAWAALLVLARAEARAPSTNAPSVAFFYGSPVPVAELGRFDWVVVEPENLKPADLAALHRAGAEVFAYVSLGEATRGSAEASWTLGHNEAWNSVIVDPAAEGWRDRIRDRVDALWERGYRGLFLDTLDSYARTLRGEDARRATAAMATLVRGIRQRHPGMKLLLNRGFELLDEVGGIVSGVAAESLLFGWDPAGRRYVEVPEADRAWLAARLRDVKEQLRIPVIVVDYLPPSRWAEAREAARRIEEMGFVPWISTPALDVLGVGRARPSPTASTRD